MKSKATSFDIAYQAGVSQSTVSRALRNSPLVNEETRLKVQAIAKALNYKVDKNASNLRTQQSATIALLLFEDPTSDDSMINPFFLSMLGSITRACSAKGYDLLVSFQQMENDWHADFEDSNKADGIILLGYGDFENYKEKFPGWDICYLENKYWDQMSPFRQMKQKNGGKWWVPGEENNEPFIEYVEEYLTDWVGYVEETVFEVNMLSINESTIVVNNYNKTVFDFLEKHHITPVIAPFRHRWFWDGGVHCVTQDLYRNGSLLARY